MTPSSAGTRVRWSPIVLLETTNLLSGMSNGVVTIAIPWLVLQRTGSVTAAGLVAALSALPGIVASPLAGWAVDHFGRRIVSIVSDVLSAISVAAMPSSSAEAGTSRAGWRSPGSVLWPNSRRGTSVAWRSGFQGKVREALAACA